MIPAIANLQTAPATAATPAAIDAAMPGFAALLASAAPQAAASTVSDLSPAPLSALSAVSPATVLTPVSAGMPRPGVTDATILASEALPHGRSGAPSTAAPVDTAVSGETEIPELAVEDDEAEPATENVAGPAFALETRPQPPAPIATAGLLSSLSGAKRAADPPIVLSALAVPPAWQGRSPLAGTLSPPGMPIAPGAENGAEAIELPMAPRSVLALPLALASSPAIEASVRLGGVTEAPQHSVAPTPSVTTMAALRLPRERDDREVLPGPVAIADPAPMRVAVRADALRVAVSPMLPAVEFSTAAAIGLAVDSARLGAVRIGIDGSAGDLKVSLGLSPAAAALVTADAPRLIADLAAGGVRLQSLDVLGGGVAGGQPQPQSHHVPANARTAASSVNETSRALRPDTPDRYA